jgi:hypothetical protein
MSGVFRRLITVAVGALAVAVPRLAAAMQMPSYDIASLAFDAQEIVLVERVNAKHLEDQIRDFETVRVKRSYAGSALHAGAEITIETSCYNFKSPAVSDERILFLSPTQRTRWPDKGAPPMDWTVEPSGIRFFADGHVYRFEQVMNPGCYGPTPGEGPRDSPYGREAFESALAQAIALAKEAHALLDAPASPQRTDKLLAIVGPPADAPASERRAPRWRDRRVGRDRIASSIFEALAREGNVPALLEAQSRTSRVHLFMSRIGLPAERFVEAARSKLPVRQRVAALAFLTNGSFAVERRPDVHDAFTALLSDPAPDVRLAALEARFSSNATPKTYLDAIVGRFHDEQDLRVRYGLFRRAKREGIVDRLAFSPGDLPFVRAAQNDGSVSVDWVGLDNNIIAAPDSVVIELRREGKSVSREIDPQIDSISGSTYDTTIHLLDLTAPPGVTPGTYDVRIELTFAGDGRPDIRRRVDVGPMELGPRRASR